MRPLKQHPIRIAPTGKAEVRSQFGALCYRIKDGKVQILLITSRDSGRWIIPKGWPLSGETPAGAAATEAFEEAGVEGKLSDHTLGFYSYEKRIDSRRLPCVVAVFPIRVKKLLNDFPEQGQRQRKWFSRKKAAECVREPELKRMIRDFDPRGT